MRDRVRRHRGVERFTWIAPEADRPTLVAYLRLTPPQTCREKRLQLETLIGRYAQAAGYHLCRIVVGTDGEDERSGVGELLSELTARQGRVVALIAGPAAAAFEAVRQQFPRGRGCHFDRAAELDLVSAQGTEMLTGGALEVYLHGRGVSSLSFVSTPDGESGVGSAYVTESADVPFLQAALAAHSGVEAVAEQASREDALMWRLTFTVRRDADAGDTAKGWSTGP